MKKDDKIIGEIAMIFFSFRDQLKIYHFQAGTYNRHTTSDILVDKITVQMDLFLETLQGSRKVRMKIPSKNTIKFSNQTDKSIIKILKGFVNWLVNILPKYLKKSETDLLNVRDEILQNVNQTLYLFTFK